MEGSTGGQQPVAAPPGGAREARHARYRAQVLSAAEQEFARAGFDATRMEAVAATAGLSLATVYKVFPGKRAIWDALHAERMDALLAAVAAAGADATSPLERLLTGVAAVTRFLTEHEGYLALNLRAGHGWASADEGRGVQRTVWSGGIDLIAAGVDGAVSAGEVAPVRPRVAAGMVVSALQVWLADWVAAGRDRPAQEVVDEMTTRLRWLLVGPAG